MADNHQQPARGVLPLQLESAVPVAQVLAAR